MKRKKLTPRLPREPRGFRDVYFEEEEWTWSRDGQEQVFYSRPCDLCDIDQINDDYHGTYNSHDNDYDPDQEDDESDLTSNED